MENNLYYTPTIEEFHVGFEYEITKYPNIPLVCTNTTITLLIEHDEYIDELRVKYLDQSDIESLGWKDCDNISNTIRWDFNDYILMFYKKDNRYLIFRDCGPNNIQTVFNGFIKNKSELIKLQQQLNIINYDNK